MAERTRDLLVELFRLATLTSLIPFGDGAEQEGFDHELETALGSLQRAVRLLERRSAERSPAHSHVLTDRERAIAECLALGKSYKDVAATFGLTVASAQSRVRAIYLKLGVHSKGEVRRLFERARPDAET